MSVQSERNLSTIFGQASSIWDLERLSHDLEDVKGAELTELELACLRGLLLYGSRKKVAALLNIDRETLRQTLNGGLYLYIGKITNVDTVTSWGIPQLLAEHGYQLKQNRWLVAIQKGLPGVSIAILIGVLINLLSNFSQTLVPSPQSAPPSCQTFRCIAVPKGFFLYSGSTAWAPIRKALAPKLAQSQPQFDWQYQNPEDGKPSSGKGIRMLVQGEIDVALTSRPLTDAAFAMAKKRALTLREVKIARGAGAVVVHKDLSIPGITVPELQQIYTGKIRNWRQVGGPNRQIQPFLRLETLDGLTKPFLGEAVIGRLGANVQAVADVTTGIRKVANTPGAIFLGSAGIMLPQCSVRILPIGDKKGQYTSPAQGRTCPYALNRAGIRQRYPASFTTFLSIVYKENDARSKEAGEALARLLLTEEGQRLVEGAGDFVRIR